MPAPERRDPSMGPAPRRSRRGDSGATLILALIFLVVVSATVLGLSSWAQGDLNSTRAFEGAQSFQSAANSATQVAIQYVRYNFLGESLNASPPTLCWASFGPKSLTFNSETVDAWCTTRWVYGTSNYRIVTISTCLSSASNVTCEQSPLLQAIVKFSDTDPSGNGTCLPVPPGTAPVATSDPGCGLGQTIESWAFGPSPPQVTVSGSCGGSAPTSVTGIGFANVVAVDAVPASSAGRLANLVYGASSFSVPSTTQILATFPQMPSGQYDIRVSTSAGSSALTSTSGFSC